MLDAVLAVFAVPANLSFALLTNVVFLFLILLGCLLFGRRRLFCRRCLLALGRRLGLGRRRGLLGLGRLRRCLGQLGRLGLFWRRLGWRIRGILWLF